MVLMSISLDFAVFFSGGRLSVFCLRHLKGNVNTRDSNLWQNVKSASGGSGWEMVEKCGKAVGGGIDEDFKGQTA